MRAAVALAHRDTAAWEDSHRLAARASLVRAAGAGAAVAPEAPVDRTLVAPAEPVVAAVT